jgi:hypothetical protein
MKDVEGSGRGLVEGIKKEFAWRGGREPQKPQSL